MAEKEPRLELRTLGGLSILLDEKPIDALVSRKAEALLVYLAVTAQPHSREHLATLLWDDRPLARSLANLSVLLNSLKKQLQSFLRIDRKQIALNSGSIVNIDVLRLHEQAQSLSAELNEAFDQDADVRTRLAVALSAYKGGFLQGFNLREARGFEEWMMLEAERIQHAVIDAYSALISSYQQARDFVGGIPLARRLLEIDPLRESAHLDLMRMLARSGDRSGALQQYQDLSGILKHELGVEPDSMVEALYEQIRNSEKYRRHNLPPGRTVLFGREHDLVAIQGRLYDPQTRLVTIVGPGGIGKSSLARGLAEESLSYFINGVFFVSLAATESPGYLPQFIGNALGHKPEGEQNLKDQLIDYIRGKDMLLILDNFEHLLLGVPLLTELLEAARGLKILVTSRQRLEHPYEWVYPLEGLPVPEKEDLQGDKSDAHLGYGAIALFEHAARKIIPEYRIPISDLPHAVRICQSVEGMPLGIELGAAWLRALPLMEVADQIASDLDFLMGEEGSSPEKPERIQAVFDRSWVLLTPEEKQVFSKLSIFRGGFDFEAGKAIAGTSVGQLASLVDKSMLRFTDHSSEGASARYDIHELVRQYAFRRAREDPKLFESVKNAHSRYYCTLLQELAPALYGMDQLEASQHLEQDLGNILDAWHWACEQHNLNDINAAISGLFRFYLFRGWFNQGATEFEAAITQLEGVDPQRSDPGQLVGIRARLRGRLGVFRSYLSQHRRAAEDLLQSLVTHREQGHEEEIAFTLKWAGTSARMQTNYSEAIGYLEEAIPILRRLGDTVLLSEAYNELGAVALRQSRYADAQLNFEESIRLKKESSDEQGIARSLINLGIVAFRTGEYASAKARTTESLEISRRISDQWGIAASLNNLGFAEEHLGNLTTAKKLYLQSLEVKKYIGHRKGTAYSLLNLAMIAYRIEDYSEALETNLRAKRILEGIKDRWGLASVFQQLGRTYLASGEIDQGREHFRQSLQIGVEIETPMYIEKSMMGLAESAWEVGDKEQASRILLALLDQEGLDPEARERSDVLRNRIEEELADLAQDVLLQSPEPLDELVRQTLAVGKEHST